MSFSKALKACDKALALIYAAAFGREEIARLLLKHGAEKFLKDGRGNTAAMHANFQGLTELERQLESENKVG